MKLTLNPNDYKHDASKSTCNNEYFKHIYLDFQLHEEHDEDREINFKAPSINVESRVTECYSSK